MATIGQLTVSQPVNVAITPDGSRAYVTDNGLESVVVIDTVTNTEIASINGFCFKPQGLAITPDGTYAREDGARDGAAQRRESKVHNINVTCRFKQGHRYLLRKLEHRKGFGFGCPESAVEHGVPSDSALWVIGIFALIAQLM